MKNILCANEKLDPIESSNVSRLQFYYLKYYLLSFLCLIISLLFFINNDIRDNNRL